MLKIAINRPISTLMVFIAMLLFGIWAIKTLPINLYPNVNIPIIKVTTIAPGELTYVENKITKELEDQISSVSGIEKITSKSFDNISIIVVQFALGIDLERSANDIREKIAKLNLRYPSAVEKISSDAGGVLSIFATPKALAAKNKDIKEASKIKNYVLSPEMVKFMSQLDDKIKPKFSRAEGIGEVKLKGFYKPAINIDLNSAAMNKYHLDAATVEKLIQARNFKVFLGELESDKTILTAKGDFAPDTISELANIKLIDGVYLKDVANVRYGAIKRSDYASFNVPGVIIELYKIAGFDTLKAIDSGKAMLAKLEAKYPDISFEVVYDKSRIINKHIRQVSFDMVFGIILTILIVFIFLRSFSATILASIAIPISIVASFGLIYLFGYDLNRLTLIALTLAIGIFVDDAIVVIERIVHHRDSSSSALSNAYFATKEIIFSVLSISIVLLCVFIPISFMHSIPGLFFNTLGMSVSFGIVISFLTCIFLVPTLAARFLNTKESKLSASTEKYFIALENGYEACLRYVLKRKGRFILLICALLVAAFALVPKIGLDFLPMEDDGQLLVEITSSKDISLDAMSEASTKILDEIKGYKDVKYATLKVAYDDAKDRKKAQIYVKLWGIHKRDLRQSAFIKQLRSTLKAPKDFMVKIIEVPKFEGAGVDDPVQYVLLGDDLNKLSHAAAEIKTKLADLKGIVDIGDDNDAKLRVLNIELDELACARANIAAAQVAAVLKSTLADAQIGYLISDNEAIALHIGLDDTADLDALNGVKITAKDGKQIDILSLVKVKVNLQSSAINHTERVRSLKITAGTEGLALHSVKKYMDQIAAPILEKYQIDYMWRGFIDLLGQTVVGFLVVLALAFVLIYLVLSALYESLIMPLIIMLTMPLAFVGASFALYLAGFSFSLFVLVALILLFGMVGKNAILVIDVAMQQLRAGKDATQALIIAGRSRIRAILMTTLAMIGAMLPLAFSHGSGYEANAPMAIAVIGGLISSTLLTLFIIPALFSAAARLDSWLRKIYERDKI